MCQPTICLYTNRKKKYDLREFTEISLGKVRYISCTGM